MQKSGQSVSFWSAVGMGIGAMVGAGIFALLGEAGTVAGSATWLSFFFGGTIALFSGYSIGKLGATYPSAGGIVEYLGQAYGVGLFSGAMSVMMYIAAVVSLALVAKAFGGYAFSMLPDGSPLILKPVLSTGIILTFVAVNLGGAKNMARLENTVVIIKLLVLIVFCVAGIFSITPADLSPDTYPPLGSLFFSLAITFFAYEGFRVITNAAEDMPEPHKTVPAAIMTSIGVVMVLYMVIGIVVFGNLPAEDVAAAKDFALAEAARPIMGQFGFTVIAIAALIATSSAINANLYAVTNVTYQLAKNGQLPAAFGRPVRHSREGLIISGFFVAVIAAVLDLGQIAVHGSISILIVHLTTHLGHLRLVKKTGASRLLMGIAAVVTLLTILLTLHHESEGSLRIPLMIAGFFAVSFAGELLLRRFNGKQAALRVKKPQSPLS